MKKFSFLSVLFLSLCLFAGNIFASGNPAIVETPSLKVIVDGVQMSPKNSPINYNGRVLLGLRELLVALGVPNDSEHIIWNSTNRTVTVKKDDKEIFLAIGSKTVSVNGQEFVLDIEPVIYKDSTYIPARFVAQSLSRFVYWDSESYSVVITKEDNYEKVLTITSLLDVQIHKPMRKVESETLLVDGSEKYKINYDIKTDVQKNIEYVDIVEVTNGYRSETIVFEDANYVYSKPDYRKKWSKKSKLTIENTGNQGGTTENASNSLSASLVIKEQDNKHIILEGDSLALVAGLTKDTALDVLKDKTSKCHVKLEIKVTPIDIGISRYEMKRMETVTTGMYETEEGLKPYQITRVIEYMLDEDVTVPVPGDLSNTYTIPEGKSEYFNANGGYALFVPKSWYLPNKLDQNPVIYYENPLDPNKYCGILISREYMDYDIRISELKPFILDNLNQSVKNCKIIKTENIVIDGYDALRVNFTGQNKETGVTEKQQVTFLICDYQLYIFTYLGEASTFELKYKEANEIIDTWEKLVFG